MKKFTKKCLYSILSTTVLNIGSVAYAVDNPPDTTYEFPAGLACSGFGLLIESWNGHTQVKDFSDTSGKLRYLIAGQGSALRYTNLLSNKTLETKANGATNQYYTYGDDGSVLLRATGHTVQILYPTDTPPGPSTTLYVGEVEVLIDSSGNYTVLAEHGKKKDICAALSD